MKKGSKMSEESRRKISEAKRGRCYGPRSDEVKAKISAANKGRVPWIKGRKLTEEHRLKISLSNKGKKLSPEQIEKMAVARRGKKMGPLSAEHKLKIGNANRGERNAQWKGGVTPIYKTIRKSPQYVEWRIAVFERDNYTCVLCFARSGNGVKVILHADHIKRFADYPELRFDVDNGRTLCVPCHKTTDTYGGKKQT